MSNESDQDIWARLREQLGEATWSTLAEHHERGCLVMVSIDLDILRVAAAVANDNTELVQEWMASGSIWKPNADEAKKWADAASPESVAATFTCVVVQPFVLAQDRGITQ